MICQISSADSIVSAQCISVLFIPQRILGKRAQDPRDPFRISHHFHRKDATRVPVILWRVKKLFNSIKNEVLNRNEWTVHKQATAELLSITRVCVSLDSVMLMSCGDEHAVSFCSSEPLGALLHWDLVYGRAGKLLNQPRINSCSRWSVQTGHTQRHSASLQDLSYLWMERIHWHICSVTDMILFANKQKNETFSAFKQTTETHTNQWQSSH